MSIVKISVVFQYREGVPAKMEEKSVLRFELSHTKGLWCLIERKGQRADWYQKVELGVQASMVEGS